MRGKNRERLSDNVATRTTSAQRRFLEQISEEHKIPLGESIRLLIDEAMAKAGAGTA